MSARSAAVVLTAVFTLFAAGCASLPAPETMRAEVANFQLPRLPADGKAMVYVVRPSSMAGLVRFNVFLDDQEANSEMGYTRNSQYIYFQVSPGPHKIFSNAENWAEAQITANAGDIIFLQQEPGMGILFARNTINRIDELPGKYHVKTLTLGTVRKLDK